MRPSERPSNNKLKLTSFASLDGLSLQLNLVLSGCQGALGWNDRTTRNLDEAIRTGAHRPQRRRHVRGHR